MTILRTTARPALGSPGLMRPGFPGPPSPAFPQVALGSRCELNLGGTWTDITAFVKHQNNAVTTITRGRQNETTSLTSATCPMWWNNRDARFLPGNPVGPYYGLLGQNTPVRWSIPGAGASLRLEDDQVSYASTAALNITGSIDVRVDMRLTSYYSSVLAQQAIAGNGNGFNWLFQTDNDGSLAFIWFDSGVTQHVASSGVPLPSLGRIAVRVTLDATTGNVTFWTAPTMSGTWTQLAQVPGTGATSIQFSNIILCCGGQSTGGAPLASTGVNGRIYEMQVRNGIGGTLAANPQFYAQAPGVTSFADAQGNTWTLHGTAAIDNRAYRFHGEASQLPQEWDPAARNIWVPCAAAGITKRLQQGSQPVMSVIRRSITSLLTGIHAPAAYWPAEDPQGSTQIASGITGGQPMGFGSAPGFQGTAGSPAADSNFACSAQLPQVNATTWAGKVSPPAGYAWTDNVIRLLLFETAGTIANATVVARAFTKGTVARLDLTYYTAGNGLLGLSGYNSAGTQLFDTGGVNFGGTDGQPLCVSLELQHGTGGNITYQIVCIKPGISAGAVSGSVAATMGAVTSVVVNPAAAALGSTEIGHLWVQGTFAPLNNLIQPLTAWNGEPAGMRFARVCAENQVPFRVYGFPQQTAAMGPQPVDTLMNIIQQTEDADRGQLYEPRTVTGVGYRTVASLDNQPPGATLDYSLGEVSPPMKPTYDDLNLRNDIILSRSNGSSYQAQVTSGPLSVLPPSQGGAGDYATSLTVYTQTDAQLRDIANWMARTGTAGLQRYPQITVDLASTAADMQAILPAVRDLDIGDHLQVRNVPQPLLPPGTIDQLIWGSAETIGDFMWQITFNTVPEQPYETFVLNDRVRGRLATDGSVLVQAAGAPLNSNPFFAGGSLAGWSAFLGTLAADNSNIYPGGPQQWSAVATVAGGGALVGSPFTATPGASYGDGAWVYMPLGGTVGVGFNWTLSGTFVSQSATSVTVPAATWTPVASGLLTAPGSGINQAVPVLLPSTAPMAAQAVVAWPQGTLVVSTLNGNSPSWTTLPGDWPFDIAIGGERITVTAVTSGTRSVTSPGTLANIVVWNVPAGTYQVSWLVTLAGTLSAGDVNNFGIYADGVFQAASVNPALAGSWRQAPVTMTVTSQIKILTGGAAPTTGAVYSATIGNPQVMTVARAVNGVSKAQPAGAGVALFAPPVLALA